MHTAKRLFWSLWRTLRWDMLQSLTQAAVGPIRNRLTPQYPPTGAGRLILARALSTKAKDGALLDGQAAGIHAKFALRKGLPKDGQRTLAVENSPHSVDDFDGVIEEGYGAGLKRLLSNEVVVVKVGGQVRLARMNYHEHQAKRAGRHFDFVAEGIPAGTSKFEVHIPRGDYKGRYAFVQTSSGFVVTRMNDHGLVLPKPVYRLKHREFLSEIQDNPKDWVVEWKPDGSLANVVIDKHRAIFRSHRDTGETYYDRLPSLEWLQNRSRFWSNRSLFPGPRQQGTVLKGELFHRDGASRMAGILNALPAQAQQIQRQRGSARFFAWDIVKHRGRDVTSWSYKDRRDLLKEVVEEIQQYNPDWDVVENWDPQQEGVQQFYDRIILRSGPFGEGVVVKSVDRPESNWFKVKDTDLADYPVVGFVRGTGKYARTLGALVVENPHTGARGEIGSLAISDSERNWIWKNRDLLEGSVAKIRMQEQTSRGVPRAGVFVAWHEGKSIPGYPENEAGLAMYAESLAGGDHKETRCMLYRLKSAAGWRN